MPNPPGPKHYFVLLHAPGPKWQDGASFREQPGIMEHVKYMMGTGKMTLGGPFVDNSGGMMIARVDSLDEAQRIAQADPAVQSGVLRVTVREWRAVFDNRD